MRTALYARYSTDKQRESSIEDQFRNCVQYAERESWQITARYKDGAISGATADRPGYQAMLADAQAGAFDVLVVDDLSRLSRDLPTFRPGLEVVHPNRRAGYSLKCRNRLDTRDIGSYTTRQTDYEVAMARQVQLNAEIDAELAKALKIRLIQDDLTYRAWLERQIRKYVSKQPRTRLRAGI